MSETANPDPATVAIGLIRAVRAASLATVDAGQPFASLVTPASDQDRSLLMLLSGLSPHTKHLRAEPRCAVMLMGRPIDANPQTAPRLSLSGTARPEPDAAAKRRWIGLHPYAAFYAGLGDFQLWRFRMEAGQFVGGFASARRFTAADLAPETQAVHALTDAEADILAHCNADHPDAMERIARAHGGAPAETGQCWQMITCDVDGCDLAQGDHVVRVAWSRPVATASAVRAQLVRLAAAAHNPVASPPGPAL